MPSMYYVVDSICKTPNSVSMAALALFDGFWYPISHVELLCLALIHGEVLSLTAN